MFRVAIICAFVACAFAASPYRPAPYKPAPAYKPAPYHPAPAYKPAPYAPKYEEYPQPYSYAYAVKDDYSGANFNAQENDDGKAVTGSYQVALPDGRIQTVTYTADHYNGYVADVAYEGTPQYPEYKPTYKPAPYHPAPAYKPAPYHPAPAYKPAPYHA